MSRLAVLLEGWVCPGSAYIPPPPLPPSCQDHFVYTCSARSQTGSLLPSARADRTTPPLLYTPLLLSWPHPIAQTCLFSSQLPLPRIFPTTSGPLVCFRVQKLVFRHHNRFICRALQRHNWPSVRVGGQGLLPGLFWGAVHWGAAGGQALPVWTAVLVVKVQFESAATMGRHCPSKPAQGPSQLSIRDSSWSATPGTKKIKNDSRALNLKGSDDLRFPVLNPRRMVNHDR